MLPKISILMGIYNCAETLSESIDSILNQTYTDWELILCDDGSSDQTCKIAEDYQRKYPKQIILLKNEKNMGLNHSLNRCLAYAQGEYIARMDGDDISLPERFEKEITFLENNPQYAIVSTPMIYFDETGTWGEGSVSAEEPQPEMLVHGTIHCHAPCMVRLPAMQKVNGYDESPKLLRVEDWHLWLKLYAAGYRGRNLAEPLYMMRDDRHAMNRRKFRFRFHEAYVSMLAVKTLKLPKWKYIFALRPILVGLLPAPVYRYLHRKKINNGRKESRLCEN